MYALRAPAPALQPFIEHYWFVTHAAGVPVDLRVEVFVDARADLIFNFGAPYWREVIGGETVEHARSNLDAQRLWPIRIVQRGQVRITGVRFRLGGLGPFARAPLAAWTNRTPVPALVLGEEATALEEALGREDDLDAQARRLDAFFGARLPAGGAFPQFTRALRLLVDSGGGASVKAIAEAARASRRHIDRLFARYLGIPPKTVGRVLRFQGALRALMSEPAGPLADVAAAAGYFDQAHFIKDFKRMSGGVPRGYRGYYPPAAPTDFAPNVVVFLQDDGDPDGETG
jgi:AraC-like DNA-binding protein